MEEAWRVDAAARDLAAATPETVAPRPLRLLILAGIPLDAELMKQALRRGGLDFLARRIGSRDSLVKALDGFAPDVVLTSDAVPGFTDGELLEYLRRRHPDVPVVVVADAPGAEARRALLSAGARFVVAKQDLRRLPPAVTRAVAASQVGGAAS